MGNSGRYPTPEGADWIKNRLQALREQIGEVRVAAQTNAKRITDFIVNREGTTILGTLDPAYRGWGPAKVKVDGVLSTDAYPWATPYVPNGSRQVRMIRNDGSWVILGQSTDETVMLDYDDAIVDLYPERAKDNTWNLRPRATKLALSGLVVLSGMFMAVGSPTGLVLGNLPPGMRPPIKLVFPIEWGDNARSIHIWPNGDMVLSAAPTANAYISLDGIAFHPAGVGTWTPVGSGGSSFGANFEAWTDPDYGPCAFYKDPWGFVWFRGAVRVKVATSLDNTNIIAMPATHRVDLEQHFRATGQDAYAGLGGRPSDGLNWKGNSPGTVGQWISLSGVVFATTDALNLNSWYTVKAFDNSWLVYGAGYTTPGYLLREDGLRMSKGLLRAGTLGARMTVMTQEEMWPSGGRIILASISNQARSRLDVFSARDIENPVTVGGPGALLGRGGANAWFSWDGLKWVP